MFKVIFMVLFFVFAIFCNGEIELKLYKFDVCPDVKDMVIKFHYNNLTVQNNKVIANYTSIITEDINNPFSIFVYLKRCILKDKLDTCEDMPVLHYNKICESMKTPNLLTKEIVYKTQPLFLCPVKKGRYETINATFDINALVAFQTKTYYWTARTELVDKITKNIILCLITKVQVIFK